MEYTNYNNEISSNYYKATENSSYHKYIVNPHLLDCIGEVKDKVILDVGCGFGRNMKFLLNYSPSSIIGIDKSEAQIEKCKEELKNSNSEFYVYDILQMNEEKYLYKFDIVYNV